MAKPEETGTSRPRTLQAALALAKDQHANREDVVVEIQAAELGRLEVLAEELRPMIQDIDPADERFDFALSKGQRPRLWIDMLSFVVIGTDRKTYRLLKDTRAGRIVMAETENVSKIADIISQYTAERVLERERMLDGERVSLRPAAPSPEPAPASLLMQETSGKSGQTQIPAPAKPRKKAGFWRSAFWFLFGIVFALAAFAASAFYFVPDAFKGLFS